MNDDKLLRELRSPPSHFIREESDGTFTLLRADDETTVARGLGKFVARAVCGELNTDALERALACCDALKDADQPNAEFWRRLAGSLRKALTL